MMSLLERIEAASDRLNPIVVKELRQAVRSRFIIGIIMLFLVVQVICTAVALASAAVKMSMVSSPLMYSVGRTFFGSLFTVLSLATMVMIPLYTAVRFSAEKQQDSVDLLFITTLSRGAIIRGKLASSSVLTLVIFSACLPFMAFSYLLRGIDLPSIFVTLMFTYVITVVINQIAIFFGALPISRGFRIVVGLILLGPCFGGFMTISTMSYAWVQMGIGSRLADWDFWKGVLLWFGVCGSITLLLNVVSVALITPPTMNRSFPVRLTIAGLWLAWGLVAVCVSYVNSDPDWLTAWAIPSLIALGFLFIAVISESDQPGNRMLRTIPRRPLLRALAFLFYNGPAGGILVCALLALLTLTVCRFGLYIFGGYKFGGTIHTVIALASCSFYMLDYGLLALSLRRAVRGRIFQRSATGVWTVILMTIIPIIPTILVLSVNGMMWENMGYWQMGNIIVVGDPEYRDAHLFFSAGWALVMMILQRRWFRDQWRAFRNPDDVSPAAL